MCWLKRDIWRIGIPLASLLLLLMLMVLVPLSAGAYEATSGLAVSGSVQATPTVDVTATMTALNEEKLRQEIQQLKNQNGNQNNWLANNSTALIAAAATVIVALFGILQWAITVRQAQDKDQRDRDDERRKEVVAQDKELKDRQNEREKRAEERFQKVVEGLGSDKPEARAGAAIMLRTFLQPGYEQFYRQVFDLAVTYLRLPLSTDTHNSEQPDSTSQALFTVFKEAVPRVRGELEDYSKLLDASRVHLDGASLDRADLSHIYMRGATLTYAHLDEARLTGALLMKANFTGADLWGINLEGASLHNAIFTNATLIKAKLMNADLTDADLTDADLCGTDLSGANLTGTILQGAKYNSKKIRMKVENGRPVIDPQGTIMVAESTKWPQGFKPDGAVDVAGEASSPSQPSVSPPLPSQSSDAQAPSPTLAQRSTPPPNTDGSSSTSSQQGPVSSG